MIPSSPARIPPCAADDCANAVILGTPCPKNARCPKRNGGGYDCVCDGTWTWGDAGNTTCIGRYLCTGVFGCAFIHARTLCTHHVPMQEHAFPHQQPNTVCVAGCPTTSKCCLLTVGLLSPQTWTSATPLGRATALSMPPAPTCWTAVATPVAATLATPGRPSAAPAWVCALGLLCIHCCLLLPAPMPAASSGLAVIASAL